MHPDAQAILAAAVILVVGSAVSAVVSPNRRAVGWVSLFFVVLAAVAAFPAALKVILSGAPAQANTSLIVPVLNAHFTFRVDALSALFVLIVSVISVLTTYYSTSYMTRYPQHHLVRYYPPLLLFFASILGLVCTSDWFFFIIFWEAMSVCSYVLVVFERNDPVCLRAGFKYVLMTHAATAGMFIAAIVLWHFGTTHSFSFDAARETMTNLAKVNPALTHILLALWLIGFGTKAGLLPFGNWLPDAYPAAPSAASAAFGGSMTKLGVYGLLRVFCWMLPPSEYSQIWGMIIAVIGAGSVFVGTLSTLPSHVAHDDSKRFLGFCAIGQIGYMMLGIGMGIYFLPINPTIAMLALMAAVFHLVNHVCYKSLLFLTSGSILFRTNSRDLNQISGLGAIMPLTAVTATVASLSVGGLPPTNGFASKWMLYSVAILSQPQQPSPTIIFLILGVMAMFISIVTLSAFLKYIGSAFLGPIAAPPGNSIEKGEVPAAMLIPQVALAVFCIGFGLFPMLPLSGVFRAISATLSPEFLAAHPLSFQALAGSSPAGIQLLFGNTPGALWLPLIGLVALAICMALSWGLARLGGAAQRQVKEWHCGVTSRTA